MNPNNLSRLSNTNLNLNTSDLSLVSNKRLDTIRTRSSKIVVDIKENDLSSTEAFFKKNSKATQIKKDVLSHENFLRIMRTDIMEIDSLIKAYSDVQYKINSTK